jgi:hypothetical protein
MTDEDRQILNTLAASCKRMETALMGDQQMGTRGIVYQLQEHEKTIGSHGNRLDGIEHEKWLHRGFSLSGVIAAVHHFGSKFFGGP